MTRLLRVAGPAVLLVVAFCALLASLAFGSGADAPLLADPGSAVRYGLPMAKLLVNLSAAGMIGSLVLACFALSPKHPEFGKALDFASTFAAVMTVASAVTGFLSFLSVSGLTPSGSAGFSSALSAFVTGVSLGQAWLATTLIAAGVTVLCFAVRNQSVLVFVTILALLTLLPMAQQGHAAGTAGHNDAVTALGLHLVFVAVWVGGLLTIILLRTWLDAGRIVPVIERYSTLAIICFVVVALSGYVSAELRIGTLAELATPYGILVLIKAGALVALGVFGLLHRRHLIDRIRTGGKGLFWWLVTAELGFMGLASGVAAALARTATPIAETPGSAPTPAEILTGEPLPAPATLQTYLTGVNFDLLWILGCGFAIFFYLAGVQRLRRRGDAWPLHRTIFWIAGIMLLFYITNGGVNVYEEYLFSAHMLAHMVLTMMVPLLLVPGAPITLAVRTIRKRADASRGPREWIMLAVHSPVAGILTNPIVAAVLFVGSLWVFYYSPLLSWATTDHIGHEWMIVYFLVVGYLFVQTLIGIDPVSYRLPYPFRLLVLLVTMGFHALFGVSLMLGNSLLLANWFGAMGRTWGPSAIVDQQAGGTIAWSVGEIPLAILAAVVAVMWSRAQRRRLVCDRDRHGVVGDGDREADRERHIPFQGGHRPVEQ